MNELYEINLIGNTMAEPYYEKIRMGTYPGITIHECISGFSFGFILGVLSAFIFPLVTGLYSDFFGWVIVFLIAYPIGVPLGVFVGARQKNKKCSFLSILLSCVVGTAIMICLFFVSLDFDYSAERDLDLFSQMVVQPQFEHLVLPARASSSVTCSAKVFFQRD